MKNTNLLGACAAPFLMFFLTLPSHADTAATTCKDGTTSTATGRGACSGHGGKQKTAKAAASAAAAPAATPAPAPAPAAAAPAMAKTTKSTATTAPTVAASNTDPTGATAKCKDGTFSKSKVHTGSCSHHGGVAEFLTPGQ